MNNTEKHISGNCGAEDFFKRVELEKLKQNRWLALMQEISSGRRELFDSIITTGQNALKGAMMINGGASIAFMAVLNSHLSEFAVASEVLPVYVWLLYALISFAVGTLFAGLGICASYFAQIQYRDDFENRTIPDALKAMYSEEEDNEKTKDNNEKNVTKNKMVLWHKICIVFVALSFSAMVFGVGFSVWGFWDIL